MTTLYLIKKYIYLTLIATIVFATTFNVSAVDTKSVWSQSLSFEYKKQYTKAKQVLNKKLKYKNTKAYAMLRMAWLEYLQGNHTSSINWYEKSISANKNSIDAHLGIVLPLMAKNRFRTAKSYVQKILKKYPSNYSAQEKLLACNQGLGQWNQIKIDAKKLTSKYPSAYIPFVYLGRAELQLGNKKAAQKAYQQVLMRFPTHIEALQYSN